MLNLATAPLKKPPGVALILAGSFDMVTVTASPSEATRAGSKCARAASLPRGPELLAETRAVAYGRVGWVGARVAVLDRREAHPTGCIRWPEGGVAHGNWVGA